MVRNLTFFNLVTKILWAIDIKFPSLWALKKHKIKIDMKIGDGFLEDSLFDQTNKYLEKTNQ